jgi:hypothetical protein
LSDIENDQLIHTICHGTNVCDVLKAQPARPEDDIMFITELSNETSHHAPALSIADVLDSEEALAEAKAEIVLPQQTFAEVYESFAVVSNDMLELLDLHKRDRYLR